MQSVKHCDLVSWGEVLRLSQKLAQQIRADNYQPDIIVTIARGGYVPARLLCDYLDQFNLASFRILHYSIAADRQAEAKITIPLNADVHNQRVLLVDDVSDSGDTLVLALQHLREFAPAEIKVAVLHHKISSPYVPDYYAKKIIKWRWLIYPWAIVEDISTFIQRMQPRSDKIPAIQQQLLLEYNISVNSQTIKLALQVIAQREQQISADSRDA